MLHLEGIAIALKHLTPQELQAIKNNSKTQNEFVKSVCAKTLKKAVAVKAKKGTDAATKKMDDVWALRALRDSLG